MADQDKYSDIQQEVPENADIEPDPENVHRGHKATISTSAAVKEHSREVLENETDELVDASNNVRGPQGSMAGQDEHKDAGNVARGLKASISNQNVSDQARERAKEKLRDLEGERAA
ncbi:hypothetical protein AAE478_007716 [Parahypoxylon ruwenzoriense]